MRRKLGSVSDPTWRTRGLAFPPTVSISTGAHQHDHIEKVSSYSYEAGRSFLIAAGSFSPSFQSARPRARSPYWNNNWWISLFPLFFFFFFAVLFLMLRAVVKTVGLRRRRWWWRWYSVEKFKETTRKIKKRQKRIERPKMFFERKFENGATRVNMWPAEIWPHLSGSASPDNGRRDSIPMCVWRAFFFYARRYSHWDGRGGNYMNKGTFASHLLLLLSYFLRFQMARRLGAPFR